MPKYFGTDGFRGKFGVVLKESDAYRIGRFIGQYNNKKNKILIGRDTRISGDALLNALTKGIVFSGGTVYDLGITTTPSVSYLINKHDFDFGIMISASHNPYFDNGIKIFSSTGEKCPSNIEEEIEKYIDGDDNLPKLSENIEENYIHARYLLDEYLYFLVSRFIKVNNFKHIAIDCAHGSASVFAKELFINRLHLNADIFNDDYDGENINRGCGSTHLEFLKMKMQEGRYDFGFAFDGDADRCLFVNGDKKVVDGDAIMYMNAIYMFNRKCLNKDKIVITSISNLGLKKALKKHSIGFDVVDVGDKYVQARLKADSTNLGGEQSGHIIFYSDLNTGDGLLTAIKTMNVIFNEEKNIDELLSDLKIYPQILKNLPVENKDKIMNSTNVLDFIKEQEEILNDNGRIVVRPSGTEQLIRVMVEAETSNKCEEIADLIIDNIKRAF